jgi:excisionase family DNA binding protein
MSVSVSGKTYYRTEEVCKMVGLGRSTLLRWIGSGIIKYALHRDRRGWRLFTQEEIKRIEDEANRINE